MGELSVFVDESGDFGDYTSYAPYYIVTMVLHNQEYDITREIEKLNYELKNMGYENHVVHTEPLIRREEDYKYLSPNTRRAIFTKCNIKYKSFVFLKKDYDNIFKLEGRMAREISGFIRDNLSYFQSFKKVILYYDNGQHELNRILNTVIATELTDYDVRRVLPSNYKLFQAADLICTLELIGMKAKYGSLSKSENLIFHSKRDLKKDFLKGIKKKKIKNNLLGGVQ